MTFKDKIAASLNSLSLDIIHPSGQKIAYLKLITKPDLDNVELIQKITQWRDTYKTCFLTEFNPTYERTKIWLEKAIINNPERVLFKIYTLDHQLVGHIGAIFRRTYIEYDYFILGVKVSIKKFSETIARFFLLWLLEIETSAEYLFGNVRSDNVHAMKFHISTGFHIHRQVPLKKLIKLTGEVSFEESTDENSDVHLIEIRATKSDFSLNR